MILTIKNKSQLDAWIAKAIANGHRLESIKGTAPQGATYDDGDLIVQPINVAWLDNDSGEVFEIHYEDTPK